MGVKVEQDKDMDKTADNTLKAIEAIVNAPANAAKPDTDPDKITLDNAVDKDSGKVIKTNNAITDSNFNYAVKKALGLCAYNDPNATAAQKKNIKKNVKVALVKTENATKDAGLQAALVKDGLAAVYNVVPAVGQKYAESGKLGSAKTSDGKYILVVIVTDLVAQNA